ncbi:phage tail sheath protein [Pseudomonas abyssi]|uniref:Phage tail protein n=1 Tax=Pseudomonas abyssi TaxID=170540 RepID=A0A395R2S4_9PSED|nr:phage tail sheath protein [Halopseudomonas gallaeciensis]RGP54406.1 phage tail protein [Halopseudomonas gallaeciensis]
MPDSYHHGVRVIEVNEGTRPIRTIATAVIGMVCTAEDADAAKFPLNTPVLITDPLSAISDAGTEGTLAIALAAIAAQASPLVVVVRVAEGADEAATTTNVIGTVTAGQYTGLKALLAAKARLGVTPRIIGVPGLDTAAVTAEMVTILQQLRAFGYAYCHDCEDKEAAVAYRDTFAARELMLIWPEFTRWDTTANQEAAAHAVAYALGLRAKIDQQVGWHKTLSNVAVNGVIGINKDVFWDLQSSSTDAGYLNENDITTLIQQDGFRFWGSRTCSDDPLFAFESATRTAQVLADTIAEAHMWAVDKPLHPSLVKDIVEGVNAKFRQLKALGYVIDANCWYDPAMNTPETLAAGRLQLDYDYTPVPPLEDLTFRQRITSTYLADFASRINA